ncbi:unnamed protein product [Notodromas monacha]|uniref:guanylate cyclase n=1 Tax=Notodromas monacha TaxID=399045 RepID=A0A7R9BWR9_9CRUS|nr:unnamed protein product [Notodromas monacha]CAG0923220.1 unnamed protein product [Notodromas monacha]
MEYGEDVWHDVLEKASLARNTIFSTHQIYPDSIIGDIATSCAELTGFGSTTDDFFEFFGRCFVRGNKHFTHIFHTFKRFWSHYGYDKFVRASGRTFRDFLQGIDNIHHQMRFGYPKMISPSMFVTQEHAGGALLHYKSTSTQEFLSMLTQGSLPVAPSENPCSVMLASQNRGCSFDKYGMLGIKKRRSKRPGFSTYVMGQLSQVGSDFYDMDLDIEIKEMSSSSDQTLTSATHTTVFSLRFENTAFVENLQQQLMREKAVGKMPAVKSGLFLNLFPFCVIFDRDMIIIDAGIKLVELIGTDDFVGNKFGRYLTIRRPKMEGISQLQNVFFEIQVSKKGSVTNSAIDEMTNGQLPGSTTNANVSTAEEEEVSQFPSERRGSVTNKPLLLRGRMNVMPEWGCLAFICMPLISSLDELQQLGLFLTDLSMHDLSREMVLAGWQHNAKFFKIHTLVTFLKVDKVCLKLKKQEERSQRLEESLNLLDQWKQRGDELLYSMIPQTVAEKLRVGGDSISTCQSIEEVTVIFSELIMANQDSMAPMEIVTCMNAVFSAFDAIMDRHDVYKVETIGQIYMCVSGAPDPNPRHATSSARVAIAMLRDMHRIRASSEAYSQCTIRLGMSSGAVVAGVVGLKLPRYCMFGDTVNTASRMQSSGLPGKVHLSELCKKFLEETEFNVEYRGLITVKGKGDLRTYWLITPDFANGVDETTTNQ